MATVIRLARFGKRHNPIYRIVVIDNRKARDDSFIEQVGFFNPNLKQPEIRFEQEKVLKWLSVGAQPSDTVKSLLNLSSRRLAFLTCSTNSRPTAPSKARLRSLAKSSPSSAS